MSILGEVAFWLVAVVLAIWAARSSWKWLGSPLKRLVPANGLERYLQILLRPGYQGGFLIAQVKGKPEFLQFVQRSSESGSRAIRSDFPIGSWSSRYEEALVKCLNDEGIEFDVFEVEAPEKGAVQRFISVAFHQDTETAARYAELVVVKVFNLEPDSSLQVHFEGVGPDEEWLRAKREEGKSRRGRGG